MSQPAKSVANDPKEPAICVNNTQELGEMTKLTIRGYKKEDNNAI